MFWHTGKLKKHTIKFQNTQTGNTIKTKPPLCTFHPTTSPIKVSQPKKLATSHKQNKLETHNKRVLNAILSHQLGICSGALKSPAIVLQHKEALLARNADELAILRPEHELGRDLDAPHQLGRLPVVEGEAADGAHAQQLAAVDVLGAEGGLEGAPLLEALEDLYLVAVPDRVLVLVVRPDELLRRAVRLVAQRHRRVNDVLAVAAHNHKPGIQNETIWIKE